MKEILKIINNVHQALSLGPEKCQVLLFGGTPRHVFHPYFVFETSGVLGPLSLTFLKELGHRLSATIEATAICSSPFQWLYKGAMQPPSEEHLFLLVTFRGFMF